MTRSPRLARNVRQVTGALGAVAFVICMMSGCTPEPENTSTTEIVRVPGDAPTITEAIDQVAPGGLVLVSPGVYEEEVTIDKEGITLRGVDRNDTVIDGGGLRSFGVFVSADGVRVQNLTVRSAQFYGVLVTGMHDENGPLAHGGPGYSSLDTDAFPPIERFAVEGVTASNNGLYGIYAFDARHGVIADSYASGSADSGFYVGQCEECDILVSGNVAERNAIGFENANASDSVYIVGNRFAGNRIGMTLISNYQEAFTPQRKNRVFGNVISGNHSSDSPAHALGGFGVGLAVNGGVGNDIAANRIEGNPVAGILLSNAEDLPAKDNVFSDIAFATNGVDVVNTSADRAPALGNCFTLSGPATFSPESLSGSRCGDTAPTAGGGVLPRVDVPSGISFLKVPQPPAQPSMTDVETLPSPLPDTITMPAAADFPLPAADFLADRAGVR
ncbi:MAG: right-handed parallel beta-helix repeat-containing protein [Microbacterium sp.]